MSRNFDGSGDWLTGAAPTTSNVLTIACWYKRAGVATDVLAEVGTSGGGDGNILQVHSGGAVHALTNAGGSGVAAVSTTTQTDTTTWHHACAVFASPTSRAAYLNGAGKGTQPLSRTPSGVNAMRIGASLAATGVFTGRIAHVAVWNIALSDAEVLSLLTMLPSQVRVDALVYYDPLTQDVSPQVDSVDGLVMTVTNATHNTDNPPIASPTITAIATMRYGASVVLTGLGFKPDGATAPTVTINGISQVVTSSSDTSVTVDPVARGTSKYGEVAVRLTNHLGLSHELSATLLPPAGWSYVDLRAPLTSAPQRLKGTPDLEDTWQIAHEDLTAGQVLSDGSFYVDDGQADFDYEINDGTGWGSTATATLEEPVSVPTLIGTIPTLIVQIGVPVQINLAPYGGGASSVSLIGTVAGLSMDSGGLVTGTPTAAGTTSLVARYTNSAGSTDSAAFDLQVLTLPQGLVAPANLTYDTNDAVQTVSFTASFSGATSYSLSGTLPSGWSFTTGVLTIEPQTAGVYGPFIVSGTNAVGTTALASFLVTVVAGDYVPPATVVLDTRPATTLRQFLLS